MSLRQNRTYRAIGFADSQSKAEHWQFLSVFIRQHRGHDSDCNRPIGGVWRCLLHVRVVIVDFPKDEYATAINSYDEYGIQGTGDQGRFQYTGQIWFSDVGLAYRYGGKAKSPSLGKYPTVSLADARLGRDQARKLLSKGGDPSSAKKKAKAGLAVGENTFRVVAEEYVARQRQNERAAAALKKLEWVLEFAYPTIGNTVISEIRPPNLLEVLRTVERRGRFETARRHRSTIGAIFRFAIASGHAEADPTTALRGALASPPAKHRAGDRDHLHGVGQGRQYLHRRHQRRAHHQMEQAEKEVRLSRPAIRGGNSPPPG